eukprot:3861567-Karenia_brevis.AAC.1
MSRSYYSGTLVKDMGKMHVEQALKLRGFDCGVGFINTHSSDMDPVCQQVAINGIVEHDDDSS